MNQKEQAYSAFKLKEMKNEKQLQAKIVMDFNQKRPEERRMLWSTRNTTFSAKDGMTQRAIGMVRGVSDLLYFSNASLIGIELKLPGTKHKVSHILEQYKWGLDLEENGGEYYIVTSLKGFWQIIHCDLYNTPDVYNTTAIKSILDTAKGTIKF